MGLLFTVCSWFFQLFLTTYNFQVSHTHTHTTGMTHFLVSDVVRSYASASVLMWNALEHRVYLYNTLLNTVTEKKIVVGK